MTHATDLAKSGGTQVRTEIRLFRHPPGDPERMVLWCQGTQDYCTERLTGELKHGLRHTWLIQPVEVTESAPPAAELPLLPPGED